VTQGEANTNNPEQYSCLFPEAIRDWRSFFSDPSLPFLFVQIGPSSSGRLTNIYGNRNDSYGMPLLDVRYAQLQALRLPAVAMATAVDHGDPGCKAGVDPGCMGVAGDNGRFGGHPRVKQPVGTRLASHALRVIYNRSTAPELEAPVVSVASLSGMTLTIHFKNVDAQRGLRFQNTTMCSLFGILPHASVPAGICCAASPIEVSGDGKHWRRTAIPKVVKNTLSIPFIHGDKFVRYAWTDTPMCMLYLGACEGCGPDPPSGRVTPPLVPFNISISVEADGGARAQDK
jgi:hypothetical protein